MNSPVTPPHGDALQLARDVVEDATASSKYRVSVSATKMTKLRKALAAVLPSPTRLPGEEATEGDGEPYATLKIYKRPDGGFRLKSPDVLGLIKSGPNLKWLLGDLAEIIPDLKKANAAITRAPSTGENT